MKIYNGFIFILLFQTVQQTTADLSSDKSTLNEGESGYVWPVLSNIKRWTQRTFLGKFSSIDEESSVGITWSKIKSSASQAAAGVKDVVEGTPGFISVIVLSKLRTISKETYGFINSAWSTSSPEVAPNEIKDSSPNINHQSADCGFLQNNWRYFRDYADSALGFKFTSKPKESVGMFDEYQFEDSANNEKIKFYWPSYAGWFGAPSEECTPEWMPGDIYTMNVEMNRLLYGQPLVINHVSTMIEHHWHDRTEPKKSLVLSFHGSTGVGKNYVSQIIVNNLFKLGGQSKFVTSYNGRLDFTAANRVEEYKIRLKNDLVNKVMICDRHVFIFDEVDMMPVGMLDVLKPFIDFNMKVQGRDFRKTTFIFISNMGQDEINSQYLKLHWEMGIQRNDVTYSQFEKVLRDGVYNDQGGLRYSDNIKYHLIDLYVPFLPMEQEEVKECIKYAFRHYHAIEPTKKDIEAVHDFVDYGPPEMPLFAKTGCKAITSKVALVATTRRKNRYSSREL